MPLNNTLDNGKPNACSLELIDGMASLKDSKQLAGILRSGSYRSENGATCGCGYKCR
jgi:hypothetical protein